MPTIHPISHTVYLATLLTISFTFDTILSQDDGLPDLDAFVIECNTESNFFFKKNMSVDTLVDL